MRPPTPLRTIAVLAPAVLLFVLSILIFVLERVSSTLFLSHTQRDWRAGVRFLTVYGPPWNSAPRDRWDYTDVEIYINYAPTLSIIGVALFAGLVSVIGLCGIWELRRVEGSARHQRMWCWFVILTELAVVGVSLGVLSWASSLEAYTGWLNYGDVGHTGEEKFTRETWVCQIDHFYPRQDWAARACDVAMATRYLLIPIAVAAAAVVASIVVLAHGRGGVKWLFGGKGRYAGFDSVYEMRPVQPGSMQKQPQVQNVAL